MRALLVALSISLVTIKTAHAKKPDPGPTFDRDAAANALRQIDLVKCKIAGGPRGEGHVFVTFGVDGATSNVEIDKGPFVKSPVERCIVALYKVAKVPAFRGEPVRVGKTFRID